MTKSGPLIVKTKMGLIRGLKSDDGDYNMFLGVPYGKVLEDDPFGFAVEYPKFDNIFDASDDSIVCPQLEEFNKTIVGSIDCLRLNIYVPNHANKKFPVIVWIHGGKFEFGSGERYFYGPKYIMRQEVILIIINYRLGPYGFMCLDTSKVPGNQSFRDVLMALKWIKQNVEHFGGAVDNITLCGHSSGAYYVEILLTFDNNLFDKAIIMSTPLLYHIIKEPNKTHPITLAQHLGFDTEDSGLALEYLAKVDPKSVIKAHIETGIKFHPCYEKKFDNVEQIIPKNVQSLLLSNSKHMPILIGNVTDESMHPVYMRSEDSLENWDVFNNYLNIIFNFESSKIKDHQKRLEKIIRRFYIGDDKICRNTKRQVTDFLSDCNYIFPLQKKIESFLRQGLNKVFYYVFSHNGNRNFTKLKLNTKSNGVTHADERGYLFDVSFELEPTIKDKLVIKWMTTMWTNFAKYGDPSMAIPDVAPIKWLPVTNDTMHYLDIGEYLTVGTRPFHQRIAFFDLLFETQQEYIKS